MNDSHNTHRACRGPVDNMEAHLPEDWWKHCFNLTYLKTDGDIVENDENTRNDIDMVVRAARLQPQHRILDLCCGQGRHSIELVRRGFGHVTGYDYSHILLDVARQRASAAGYAIDFRQGDIRDLATALAGQRFDCVTVLGSSFGYFARDNEDLAVLTAIRGLLAPGGTLVLDLCNGDWLRQHYQPHSWEWLDERTLVCRERAFSADGRRLVSREIIIDTANGVTTDQFYAERLYSREQITAALEQAGFRGVQLHNAAAVCSTRNQDLGFMENLMVLSARSPDAADRAA